MRFKKRHSGFKKRGRTRRLKRYHSDRGGIRL